MKLTMTPYDVIDLLVIICSGLAVLLIGSLLALRHERKRHN